MRDGRLTYFMLREVINRMSDEELQQSVQILPHSSDGDKPIGLMPVLGLDTIEGWEAEKTRSEDDCRHHPEQWALLVDYHSFGPNGEVAYDLDGNPTMWAKGFGPNAAQDV